jgi:GntR family transcriptional regulator, rspAB operon transcriptional repressor
MTRSADENEGGQPTVPTQDSQASRRAGSASATIYRALRDDILRMRRRPGDPIVEKQIARAYGVSRTPVREAMLKLSDEGLVDIFPQSGTYVARIPVDELPESMAIRRALEEGAVKLAAALATVEDIHSLQGSLELQRKAMDKGDWEAFHNADESLHCAIANASGYPRFWEVTQQVKVHIDRFRRLALPEPGRIERVFREHAAIVEAIADHDPVRAVAAMNTHQASLRENLTMTREASPYYFSSGKRD